MNFTPDELWSFLFGGYFFSIAIETPVLLVGLSRRHSLRDRLLAGIWLTACTYPIVVLVLPLVLADLERWLYLAVAETFAPAAECALFYLVWIRGTPHDARATWQDMLVVTLANLASFGLGELYYFLERWPTS